MALRRRVALLALVGVVVLALVALALVQVVHRRAAEHAPLVDQGVQGTVLLVPGYGGSTGALDVLAGALRAAGRTVAVVGVAGDGTGDLHAQAGELDRSARTALAGGAPSVDVVGYSAGGVVARLWLAGAGAADPVRRVVTLGAPHHGTDLAEQAGALSGAVCPTACQQLEPGSDLLSSLPATPDRAAATTGRQRGAVWVSVWSDTDEVVVPPRTASSLAGAVDVDLQSVCADAVVAHGQLPRAALPVGVVAAALDGPALTSAPGPGRCAALTAAGRQLLAR